MPVLRSQRSYPPLSPLAGRPRSNPMSLSQLLREPSLSPFNKSNTVDSAFQKFFSTSSGFTHTPTHSGGDGKALSLSNTPRTNDENYNPRDSPNPFIVSPRTDPVTPRSSYPSLFGNCWTSPFVDSPTSGGLHSRALRRHGAVALLVPQTPSTPTLPAASCSLRGARTTVEPGSFESVKAERESSQPYFIDKGMFIVHLSRPHDNISFAIITAAVSPLSEESDLKSSIIKPFKLGGKLDLLVMLTP